MPPNRPSCHPRRLFLLQLGFFLFLFPLFVPSSALSSSSYAEHSDPNIDGFVPLLRRTKRTPMGVANEDLLDMNGGTLPPDVEMDDSENEDNNNNGTQSSTSNTEHTYYNMTIYTNQTDIFEATYVNVANWIRDGGAEGSDKNDHLAEAYRKAAGVRLKFEFPFYGHRLHNLTIATGGFLYVGDQTHSWLAATQYIAPLMANFDTTSTNSSIQHADDGKRMIVEWRNVTLRDHKAAGPFTFQVQLWKNGNITFVYKQVPIPVVNISDAQHPCKLGISDAYLFNHKVSTPPHSPAQPNKRVIHEYHRITIPAEKIVTHSVVMLQALKTCLDATTCEDCINMQLKSFKCSWCPAKEGGKHREGGAESGGTEGKPEKPFCSNQLGLHRRRQDWIEGGCQLQEENQYCKADETVHGNSTLSSSIAPPHASSPSSSTPADATPSPAASGGTTPAASVAKPTSKAAEAKAKASEERGGGGLAFITLFMLVGISISVWMLYAYFNPHTRSGQLLIKYRPSKWQIPSSHVRYSASVHM